VASNLNITKNNIMQNNRKKRRIEERIAISMAAWKNQAPEASFSGLTTAQAEAALAPPRELRVQILALEKELEGLRMQRIDADAEASKLLDSIVSSIKGSLEHGKDSPIYRSFGYIRQSEKKSGGSRKKPIPVVPVAMQMDAPNSVSTNLPIQACGVIEDTGQSAA
jgi:hypothetical protein